MKILILGATGKTGRLLVNQALEKGYFVTAFARNPSSINLKHPNFNIFKGNILDNKAVDGAVKGKGAVISALGTKSIKKDTSISDGVRNIINAMKNNEVKRIIFMSSLGVGDSRGQLKFLYNYFVVPFILKNMFEDKERQEKLLLESDLDWTIVRPGVLTSGIMTGNYKTGFSNTDKSIKVKISRSDVAHFILKQITDNTYVKRIVGLSY